MFLLRLDRIFFIKIRLANRTDEEVYNDAQEYLFKAQATYTAHAAMLDEITADLTYQQTIDLQKPIIEKANTPSSFWNPYPLINFVSTLQIAMRELTNHDKWLVERLAKFDVQLETDYITKFNDLSEKIKAFNQKLYSLYLLIYHSNAYHYQRVAQLEALARVNNTIVYI